MHLKLWICIHDLKTFKKWYKSWSFLTAKASFHYLTFYKKHSKSLVVFTLPIQNFFYSLKPETIIAMARYNLILSATVRGPRLLVHDQRKQNIYILILSNKWESKIILKYNHVIFCNSFIFLQLGKAEGAECSSPNT